MAGPNLVDFEISIPGLSGGGAEARINPEDYRIRYFKADLDDPDQLLQLEELETRGIRGTSEIIIVSRKEMVFQANVFVLLCYMEKREQPARKTKGEQN